MTQEFLAQLRDRLGETVLTGPAATERYATTRRSGRGPTRRSSDRPPDRLRRVPRSPGDRGTLRNRPGACQIGAMSEPAILTEPGPEPAAQGSYGTDPQIPGFNYDVVSGVDYVVDIDRPVGERITKLQYRGRDVAATDTFTMALNNYRQSGGGGFSMLRDAPVVYDKQQEIRQLLIDEVRARGTLDPADYFQHNWELRPTAAFAILRTAYLSCVEMLLNLSLSPVPSELTTAMIAIEIPAAISPYSIAVAPCSFLRNATS